MFNLKRSPVKKIIYLLFFFSSFGAFGQWAQEKGKGYYKIGVWSLVADEHYTNTGRVDPNATRGLVITHLFSRYGLTDQLTLVGYLPHTQVFQNRQVFSSGRNAVEGEKFSSFGDINLGLEYQWFAKKGWAISSSLTLGLPTGKSTGGSDGSYQTGDGEFNQLIRLHLGKSYRLRNQRFYAKGSLGFNQRNKGFSDELRFSIETGTKILQDKLLLLTRISHLNSLENGYLNATNSNGSIFANNVEVTNWGAETIYAINKKWSVLLSGSIPLSGRLIYKAPAFAAGISFQP